MLVVMNCCINVLFCFMGLYCIMLLYRVFEKSLWNKELQFMGASAHQERVVDANDKLQLEIIDNKERGFS
ncbi:hypothetical protein L1887_19588 [Cichorium endivia]|nr:hypothetical protein L1887_19588 [Cichorium endivia]